MAEMWNQIPAEYLYTPSAYVNRNGEGVVTLHRKNPVPPEFGLELGEMLYQLRAALDGAIYQAAVFETGQDPPPNEQDLEFPIYGDAKIYGKNSPRMLGPLSDKRQFMIEAVQPYHAENIAPRDLPTAKSRCLDILHEWARIDRHRRLHVVGSWASSHGPLIRIPDGVTLESLSPSAPRFLEDKNVIATFRLRGDWFGMKIQVNPQVRTDVAVNEAPLPCCPDDTFETRLRAIAVTVSDIVSDLENSF